LSLAETFLLLLGGYAAGMIGSLFGLGGGVLLVPLLVIVMKVPIHNAIATSLVSVIATSSATASRNVRYGTTNMRLGTTLETATVAGAVLGGAIAGYLPPRTLTFLFAFALAALAVPMARGEEEHGVPAEADDTGFVARLQGAYFDAQLGREVRYGVRRFPLAMSVSGLAGTLSGLLGVGGGVIKVPALTLYCGVPVRAAAATSNFMIGVTAVASAFVYYGRGDVLPVVTAAAVLGVFAGSRTGLWIADRLHAQVLRKWFALLMLVVAAQMAWKALS
jgi:uncharacterized membrane protein YfcA